MKFDYKKGHFGEILRISVFVAKKSLPPMHKNTKLHQRCLFIGFKDSLTSLQLSFFTFLIIISFSSSAQVYDTLKDPRDGRWYQTVKIGNQVWMAENLNYKSKKGSYCYGYDKGNCIKYGRLYTWDVVYLVCPTGWHASTQKEWQTLVNYLGGTDSAAMHLKLKSSLWKNQNPGDDNSSGFSALPAGKMDFNHNYQSLGRFSYFWIANGSGEYAWCSFMNCSGKDVTITLMSQDCGLSLRCVKD